MKNQFSADYASYEIFEPNRNRFWYNQLFNADGYTASVTNVGHGTSRYIDQTATHAVLNEREERFLYLRDEESKACWSVGKFPLMEPVDRLFCEHSMGFSRIETDNLGIEAAWTLFVPVHGYHEVWLLRLRNTTDRPRTISAFPLVSFDLGGFQQPAYYVPFNCTETIFDGQLQGIFAWNKNPHNPHPRYSGFLASSLPPAAYDGCLERFLGIMGSTARPERLLAGEACTNSLTTVLGLGAVLQNTVTLLPGQKQTICYTAGLAVSLEDARAAAQESFRDPQSQLEAAQRAMRQKYDTLHAQTPDVRVNSIFNYWTQKQVDFCSLGKKAVRDNAQVAMAQLNFAPEQAERTISECLCHQYQDGHAVLGFGPTLDPNLYSDPHMWLILACCELVKETGDTSFLQKKLPFQDGGEAGVYEHLKRAMQYMINDAGAHGIPRIRYADWNDALNIDDPEAESVFMAMAMAWACKELAALSRFLGDNAYALQLLEQRAALVETINRMNRITRQILQETGVEPDSRELAKLMELPEDKILKIMKIAKEPISMETPIGDDDDSHLGDFLEDTQTVAPAEAIQNTSLSETVRQVLDSLSPREAKVLRMRFGIEMQSDHTLEEVGKQFDVTRERIRQIETKALRKLRHPSRADKLRSFVEGDGKD